jgi:hypothetical protein
LIEAMGAGNCALTLRTPENLEVIGDAGIVYESVEDLTTQLQKVIDDPSMIGEFRRRAMARVMQYYYWEYITDQYEELLASLAGIELPVAEFELTMRNAETEAAEVADLERHLLSEMPLADQPSPMRAPQSKKIKNR